MHLSEQQREAVKILRDFSKSASPSASNLSLVQDCIDIILPLLEDPATVTLMHCGPTKIQVIKAIRQWTNLGLKEAKDISDMVPKEITFASRDIAERFVKEVEPLGAKVSYLFSDKKPEPDPNSLYAGIVNRMDQQTELLQKIHQSIQARL